MDGRRPVKKNLGGFCVVFCFVPDGSLLAPAGLDCTM